MNKFAVSLLALAALSTAAFAAPGDGVDTDAPRIFNDNMPASKSAADQSYVSQDALSAGIQDDRRVRENYINPSQLR